MRIQTILLAAACTLPMSLVACGGGDDGSSNQGDDDGSNSGVTPTGDHHQYVVKKATVASSKPEDLSLDFGSKTGTTPDGKVDNRLGNALNLINTLFPIQTDIDAAVNDGSLILLLDVQTTDFTNNTAGAGFAVKFGENPSPAACTDPADATTCGKHLQGGAMFTVAANSPANASLAGKVINGVFNAGPGNVGLQIAFGESSLTLNLVHARAQLSGMTANGVASIKVGGLLTQTDLTTQVGPAIKTAVDGILTRDCPAGAPVPSCGCVADSTGAKVILALDGDTGAAKDCKISVEEILGLPVVASALQPDSCSKDTCDAPDALSVGVKVEAVSAVF